MWGHWKIQYLGSEGSRKNKYIVGIAEKGGAWTVCRFKRVLSKKRAWCFWRGVNNPMHTTNRSKDNDVIRQ